MKRLLLFWKIKKLEDLISRKGNYGGLKLSWSDGRGTWIAEVSLGMGHKEIIIGDKEPLTLLEVLNELEDKLNGN